MDVALVQGGIGTQAIQIFVAIHIVHPHTFGTADDNIQWVIIMGHRNYLQCQYILVFACYATFNSLTRIAF